MKWNRLAKESNETGDGLDSKYKSTLDQLLSDCRKKERETLDGDNRFRVYGYQGQDLHNFWLAMGRVVEDLRNGVIGNATVEDLDNALTAIYYSDRHKTPGPTDPRDVR